MATQSSYPMVDVDVALATVLKLAESLGPTTIDLESSPADILGKRLATAITSKEPAPRFAASIMDGYAVVASDGPGKYAVVSNVTAGSDNDTHVVRGTVAYITTGAPVPQGADAVVPVEDTQIEADGRVHIKTSVEKGKWIREIGSDMQAGEEILNNGELMGAAEIGLLASVGITEVPVVRSPVVGVFSTGDELVSPSQPATGSKIRDSNRAMLLACASECGADILDFGIVVDQQSQLRDKMMMALKRCDVVVTSGGVSMGSLDLVKPLLEELGTVHFGRLNMKPGKPTTFATIIVGDTTKYVFGLPGNPVSSVVTFKLLVEPCIRRLSGATIIDAHHTQINVQLSHPMRMDPARPEYHRVVLEWRCSDSNPMGNFVACSTGAQRSSRLLSMRASAALAYIPKGSGVLPTGSIVKALLVSQRGGLQLIPGDTVVPHTADIGATSPQRPLKPISSHNTSSFSNSSNLAILVDPDSVEEPPHNTGCLCCQTKQKDDALVYKGEVPMHGGITVNGTTILKIGVITVSDRASSGKYEDKGGPEVLRCLDDIMTSLWRAEYKLVSDDVKIIKATIEHLIDVEDCALVVTTGGTGPTARDVTPEATISAIDRELPGFGEQMRAMSLKHVATAVLSRQLAGTRGTSFVINLPGSPRSIKQILPGVFDAMAYCIQLIRPGSTFKWDASTMLLALNNNTNNNNNNNNNDTTNNNNNSNNNDNNNNNDNISNNNNTNDDNDNNNTNNTNTNTTTNITPFKNNITVSSTTPISHSSPFPSMQSSNVTNEGVPHDTDTTTPSQINQPTDTSTTAATTTTATATATTTTTTATSPRRVARNLPNHMKFPRNKTPPGSRGESPTTSTSPTQERPRTPSEPISLSPITKPNHLVFAAKRRGSLLSKTYTIDAANVAWLTKVAKKLGNQPISGVVKQVVAYTQEHADENFVFQNVRGCGRKKVKSDIECNLGEDLESYLAEMVTKHELPDVQKGLRIILDYAMEDFSLLQALKSA